jgi:hypothetical protein
MRKNKYLFSIGLSVFISLCCQPAISTAITIDEPSTPVDGSGEGKRSIVVNSTIKDEKMFIIPKSNCDPKMLIPGNADIDPGFLITKLP